MWIRHRIDCTKWCGYQIIFGIHKNSQILINVSWSCKHWTMRSWLLSKVSSLLSCWLKAYSSCVEKELTKLVTTPTIKAVNICLFSILWSSLRVSKDCFKWNISWISFRVTSLVWYQTIGLISDQIQKRSDFGLIFLLFWKLVWFLADFRLKVKDWNHFWFLLHF